ncbi:hypothetical protein L6452_27487 [Arctium lappa]|uniref:Uncharacterized protein n=1 Tax=Arctium lappa TaxID=4217 RepID=A0ACB8ZX88_ARCLA|nr:hypothetical protein L6452_27487 [Arctium lappa]
MVTTNKNGAEPPSTETSSPVRHPSPITLPLSPMRTFGKFLKSSPSQPSQPSTEKTPSPTEHSQPPAKPSPSSSLVTIDNPYLSKPPTIKPLQPPCLDHPSSPITHCSQPPAEPSHSPVAFLKPYVSQTSPPHCLRLTTHQPRALIFLPLIHNR